MMEFRLMCSKSWKTMLWKCDTQYVSKFGKLSSGNRTGKGQFSFQRKARLKNAHNQYHTIVLISHASKVMLALKKFSKPGFNNMWTMIFQISKLVLEKAEEPKTNFQHPLDHQKSMSVPENIYFCFTDYAKSFDCVDHNQLGLVTQACPTLCDLMKCSTPGLPVHHQLPEPTLTHVHWVSDASQPSRPLLSPFLPTLNFTQHQGLFK